MLRTALSAIAASPPIIDVGLVQAQPTRVLVAAQGSDSNPCAFALPYRTFHRGAKPRMAAFAKSAQVRKRVFGNGGEVAGAQRSVANAGALTRL